MFSHLPFLNRRDLLARLGLASLFLPAAACTPDNEIVNHDTGSPPCPPCNETLVANFTVREQDVDEDGVVDLEDILIRYARNQGIELVWGEFKGSDAYDCRQSVSGIRLVRWDFLEGTSTDMRLYRFDVLDENGQPIGNTPSLDTLLRAGYRVKVWESLPPPDVRST